MVSSENRIAELRTKLYADRVAHVIVGFAITDALLANGWRPFHLPYAPTVTQPILESLTDDDVLLVELSTVYSPKLGDRLRHRLTAEFALGIPTNLQTVVCSTRDGNPYHRCNKRHGEDDDAQ